jgi:serine/threonine protein phosphatase 1
MLRLLLDHLEGLPLAPEDTLVFIGDYIDRGENTRAVIETLLDLRRRHENVVFLRGNHEQLMLDARDGPPPEASPLAGFILHTEQTLNWLQNGGVDTLLSYEVEDYRRWWEFLPDAHWEFLRATQREYITERYHFVHAGLLPPGKHWEAEGMELDPRLWIREPFLSSRADFDGRLVVFGHTPQTSGRPLVQRNKIGIDTGAVYGGPLTAAVLEPDMPVQRRPDVRFYQVPPVRLS